MLLVVVIAFCLASGIASLFGESPWDKIFGPDPKERVIIITNTRSLSCFP